MWFCTTSRPWLGKETQLAMSKQGHSEGEASQPKADNVTKSTLATIGNQILPFAIGGGSGIVATTCLQPVVSDSRLAFHVGRCESPAFMKSHQCADGEIARLQWLTGYGQSTTTASRRGI